MADYGQSSYPPRKSAATPFTAAGLIQKLRDHAPTSTRLTGFATLVISGSILLLLSGVTLTAMVLGLVFLIPLIIICSPIWIPLTILFFISAIVLVTPFGFSVATTAVLFRLYSYLKGDSDRFDSTAARHSKNYAGEPYGGYFQSKSKDAAPGA